MYRRETQRFLILSALRYIQDIYTIFPSQTVEQSNKSKLNLLILFKFWLCSFLTAKFMLQFICSICHCLLEQKMEKHNRIYSVENCSFFFSLFFNKNKFALLVPFSYNFLPTLFIGSRSSAKTMKQRKLNEFRSRKYLWEFARFIFQLLVLVPIFKFSNFLQIFPLF